MSLYLCACNDVALSLSLFICTYMRVHALLFVLCFLMPSHKRHIRFYFFPNKNTFKDVVIKIFIWKWSFSLFYYVKIETGYLHSETCLVGPAHTLTHMRREREWFKCILHLYWRFWFSFFGLWKIVEMKCVVQFAVKIVHINFIDWSVRAR